MVSQPMPPMNQDPAYVGSQQLKQTLDATLQRLRTPDGRTTELQRAAAIVAIYNAALARMQTMWDDWTKRADARIAWLEAQQPVGPGVGPDVPPADREVLLTAFRTLLAEARDGTTADREQMLRDAVAFGDQMQRRAATTAMVEAGERRELTDVVESVDPDAGAQLTEWLDLTSLRAGNMLSTEGLFQMQGMKLPPRPPEVAGLQNLARIAGVTPESVTASADVQQMVRVYASSGGVSWTAA
jgi:hypothetical protein